MAVGRKKVPRPWFRQRSFLEEDFLNVLKGDRAELGHCKGTGTFSHICARGGERRKEKASERAFDVGAGLCANILDIWVDISSRRFLRPEPFFKDRVHKEIGK